METIGEEIVIASTADIEPGTWRLWFIPAKSGWGWYRLALERPKEAKRPGERAAVRRYDLAWNGERLARGPILDELTKRSPPMVAWVEEVLPIWQKAIAKRNPVPQWEEVGFMVGWR